MVSRALETDFLGADMKLWARDGEKPSHVLCENKNPSNLLPHNTLDREFHLMVIVHHGIHSYHPTQPMYM